MAEPEIDWRDLLVRYMAHVRDREGVTFVSELWLSGSRFAAAEVAALERIEREAEDDPQAHDKRADHG